ncbi:unnamed protein product [Allacma fusca]|uniref:Uncharacterized protein n=1 Tax=Allacma fusca TaxID=39272 RepID=A0A8J2LJR1_9HEXA|nr:unnamed protein product [Allacma fusca]
MSPNQSAHDKNLSNNHATSYEVGDEGKELDIVTGTGDPWEIQEAADVGTPWKELSSKEKAISVAIGIAKALALLTLLYFFVCSLDLLSLGFRLVGGRTTGEIFRQSEILKNPIVGVMIGILTTVLVQSSSTSTSIIVSMVSAKFMDVRAAIPIIMGANIGTSVTNTIVSLTQAGDRNQFRRAFAGATVHDMFNWLTVITLLILEVCTGYLFHLTSAIMSGIRRETASGGEIQILTVITKPFVNLIVQLDKKVLECWSKPGCETYENASLIKSCSKTKTSYPLLNESDSSSFNLTDNSTGSSGGKCFLFAGTSLSDEISGAIVLVGSLTVLCVCLILIVKVLNSVLKGQIATVIRKTINANIPYFPWLTGYLAILVGAVMTFLVQSSSVFTSALTPLVGVGVISIERMYPLTLGSNIGTTTTALIAALAVRGNTFHESLQIALCHLFFNITGILLFYPVPFTRVPIKLAKSLGNTTAQYRWFAIVYMLLMFLVLPAIIMGLSFAGTAYVITFASILLFVIIFVLSINFLRKKNPECLPQPLHSWKWLPRPLRSLDPYDELLSSLACCRKLKEKSVDSNTNDGNLVLKVMSDKSNSAVANAGHVNTAYVD